MGIPNNLVAKINLEPNHNIFSYKSRRLSFLDKQEVNRITNDLLDRQIIKKSSSSYSSPIVLSSKKNWQKKIAYTLEA